jgi:HlyD family secretion protein
MTANVSIVVGARDDALKVPSRALRFRPEGAEAAPSGGAAAAPGKWQARRQRLMKGLTERLGLDEKQQAGVGAIYDQTAAKVRDMVRQGVPPEEIRPLVQEMRARNRPRVEALLDEAQRKKFRALVALRSGSPIQGGRVWVQGEDGAPRPVDVRHGISDDSFSEIVSGELEAGQEVIVGVEPAASGKTGGRPRLGF